MSVSEERGTLRGEASLSSDLNIETVLTMKRCLLVVVHLDNKWMIYGGSVIYNLRQHIRGTTEHLSDYENETLAMMR